MMADPLYFEPLSEYKAIEGDFCAGLRQRLPKDWRLSRGEIWTYCSLPGSDFPDQGWKIHLSATPAFASSILSTVAPILIDEATNFKFVSDKMLLMLSLSKRWQRGGSGKFIAIYPRSADHCGRLLERIHAATVGFGGPYILSDRRYKDSKVVYYRYGGLKSVRQYQPDGSYTLQIQDADGQYVDDERNPFFSLPAHIVDPFQAEEEDFDDAEAGTLAAGRFKIDKPIVFSNSGGVYKAVDRETDEVVIIKEARPLTNISSRGLDAMQLLKKEHRILDYISDLHIAPEPRCFFHDWEHAYLVEEYLGDAVDFRNFMNRIMIALKVEPTREDSQLFIDKFCAVFDQLFSAVIALHERNIVFGDLSMANVMITETPEGLEVKLIDFEGAHEENVDIPSHLYTPGFSAMLEDQRSATNQSDDYYALGSLMLSALMPINQLLVLDRTSLARFLEAIGRDFGIPHAIRAAIIALFGRKVTAEGLVRIRDSMRTSYVMPAPSIDSHQLDMVNIPQHLEDIVAYLLYASTPDRNDRLFPADPDVFSTNPLGVAYGACGVALVLHRILGEVPEPILDWIKARDLGTATYPPGLHNGLSGMAWSWLELGDEDRATQLLARADAHPMLARRPEMFNGLAGWGSAHLRFLLHSGDQRHLEQAKQAGDLILESRDKVGPDSARWFSGDDLCVGYGHGAAGISGFLLDLYGASGDGRYLEAAAQGLEWIRSVALENADGWLSWRAKEDVPSSVPYMRWGSAGIVRTYVKYWRMTHDDSVLPTIDAAIKDCDRKYTIFPGYNFGLSGLADLFLDLREEPRWRETAERALQRTLSGVLLFALQTDHGIAYPGDGLGRISCDLATGSAGIAYVLHRYLERTPPLLTL
jgi:serine/threonine protein kinase